MKLGLTVESCFIVLVLLYKATSEDVPEYASEYTGNECGGLIENTIGTIIYQMDSNSDWIKCVWLIVTPPHDTLNVDLNVSASYDIKSFGDIFYDRMEIRENSGQGAILWTSTSELLQDQFNTTTNMLWIHVQAVRNTIPDFVLTWNAIPHPYITEMGKDNETEDCPRTMYTCPNLECISWSYVCDNVPDCGCSIDCDENNCPPSKYSSGTLLMIGTLTGLVVFVAVIALTILIEYIKRRGGCRLPCRKKNKKKNRSSSEAHFHIRMKIKTPTKTRRIRVRVR